MPTFDRPEINSAELSRTFSQRHFSTAQAYELGFTKHELTAAITRGLLVRDRRGQLRVPDDAEIDRATRALRAGQQAVLAMPGAVVSHETAADILGISYLRSYTRRNDHELTTLTTPDGSHQGRDGWRTVSADVPADQIVFCDGTPITSPERTAIDLARGTSFRESLAAMDSAIRMLMINHPALIGLDPRIAVHNNEVVNEIKERMLEITYRMRRWPGVRTARHAIKHANPASESPLESVSRGTMIDARVPGPLVGQPIDTELGRFWADFLWREERLIGEADGALKYLSRADAVQEKRRQNALEHAGFTVIRWMWDDAVTHPERLTTLLHHSLDR